MRLSRGRSTPTRRAMWWPVPFGFRGGVWSVSRPRPSRAGPRPPVRGRPRRAQGATWRSDHREVFSCPSRGTSRCGSALALLVARVLADHHDAAVATDHLALVTDRLDARVDLHQRPFGWLAVHVPRGPGPDQAWRPLATRLLVPVDDPTAGQVVRRELDHDPVLGEDADVVLPHLAADVGEDLVPVAQLDPEHRVRERLDDGAFDLDHAFFLRHVLRILCSRGVESATVGPGTAPRAGRLAYGAGGPREPAGRLFPGARREQGSRCVPGSQGRHETSPRWADASVYGKRFTTPNRAALSGRRRARRAPRAVVGRRRGR